MSGYFSRKLPYDELIHFTLSMNIFKNEKADTTRRAEKLQRTVSPLSLPCHQVLGPLKGSFYGFKAQKLLNILKIRYTLTDDLTSPPFHLNYSPVWCHFSCFATD